MAEVLHPALPASPAHALWLRDYTGSASLFGVVMAGGSEASAHALMSALELFGLGYSWGGYESLAVHVNLSDRKICTAPKEGPVLRLQIGLEDIDDIRADVERGLAAARAV